MHNSTKKLFFSVLTFSAVSVSANSLLDYKCTIEKVEGAPSDSVAVLENERKNKIGREFTIERRSGKMIGALKNSFATEPVVIDVGSSENAYKVITTMTKSQGYGRGSRVYALVVNEYDDSLQKPFVFMAGDTVYFGRCVYFQ